MTQVSTTPRPDTAEAAQDCPDWCRVDHESGATACQSERHAVVRVPAASIRDASSVHAFQVGEGSELRLSIDGKSFTLGSAREYAAKIVDTCDSVTKGAGR